MLTLSSSAGPVIGCHRCHLEYEYDDGTREVSSPGDPSAPPVRHRINRLDSEAYLRDILARIADHPINRIPQLLPWNWRPVEPMAAAA